MYLFDNLSAKSKMFLSIMLSQIGFIAIGVAGQMSNSIEIIIALNIIFAIVVGGFNYMASASLLKGLNKVDKSFRQLLLFLTFKQNKFQHSKVNGDSETDRLLKLLNETAVEFDKNIKSDMKVMGEIILAADKVEQGIFTSRIKSSTSNPMIATLKNTFNKMISETDKNMNLLKHSLENYTNDDFRNKIVIPNQVQAELRAVMESVNKLGDALVKNAKNNMTHGMDLEIKAEFMEQSVAYVAKIASEQAASLEQTAASLEEITSLTRSNTENTVQMANLGKTVRVCVKNGEQLAASTSKSMDDINEQVSGINEAIILIDQIAFQTSILSLNAAVEAATAGEAGKGFAVVAGEVRNLANKSADAAKEIKSIVESATNKAIEGKKICNDMIQGYQELNFHMDKTLTLINDISVSSNEQMTGIEQINNAVAILDKVTQENASEANNVSSTAREVLTLSHELVSDAKTKKY